MNYRSQLIKEINKLKKSSWVDKNIFDEFIKLINSQNVITKPEGAGVHICSFFIPINKKSIFLVDHIKAQDWIPPGGHIEKDELPIETVKREFEEELDHQLTNEKIELFDLSIKEINRAQQNCLTHYDIWYLVYVDKIKFNWLKKEFHDAEWIEINKGIKKMKIKLYANIIKKLLKYL